MSTPVEQPAPVELSVFVPGAAVPKGSTRAFVVGGKTSKVRAVVVPDNKIPARSWAGAVREDTQRAWREAGQGGPLTGEVTIRLEFVLPRRRSAPKRSTPAHTRKPDIDKLTRLALDALTSVVWADDAQVTDQHSLKREAQPDETPGLYLLVTGSR